MKIKQNSNLSPLIQLQQVVKTYPNAQGGVSALNGITQDFFPAEFVGILGKSGAGKTTLTNMITATDTITSGEVFVHDIAIHQLNPDQSAKWRGTTMGIIYQSFRLMPTLSLVDNIRLPIDFCGKYAPKPSVEKALELLREMGLEDHAFKKPSEISGGQQQRVAIARALANDPPIIIADEPTGRLDSVTADLVMQIFVKISQQGKLVIMATHDIYSTHLFTRLLRINEGKIMEDRDSE